MCDAICDGGVRCTETPQARRARQRLGYALARSATPRPPGSVAVLDPPAAEPVVVEPPRKPQLSDYTGDIAELERAVTAWGAELTRRAHELAGITPEDIREDCQQRQRDAEMQLPILKARSDTAGTQLSAARQALTAPQDADPALVEGPPSRRQWRRPAEQWTAYDQAVDRSFSARDDYIRHLNLARAAGRGEDEETIRQLDRVAAAYREVLAGERPMGGKVLVGKKSSPRAKAALLDAVAIYPTAWIEASNDAHALRPLMAVANPGRAFYAHEGQQLTKTDGVKTRLRYQPADWQPAADEADDYEREPSAASSSSSGSAGQVLWREKVYEHKFQRDQPRGAGWVESASRVWRRHKAAEEFVPISELRVGLRGQVGGHVGGKPGASTAAHEFGHRCQRLVDGISDLERAFLNRRTAGTDLEPYGLGTKDEWVQPDSFADRYMGKDYRAAEPGVCQVGETKATEVLTTGVEAIFANRFGALAGLGGRLADPDMRNFVIGMMATI